MLTKQDVRRLSDEGLVSAITEMSTRTMLLTEWERQFVSELPQVWTRHGTITWKQRRAAREILERLVERAARA